MTLPAGLKKNITYGIQHVKTGLFLSSIEGVKDGAYIGILSDSDDILWDPNSMFVVEEGGSAKGDFGEIYGTTIRIKSANDDLYVTTDGKYYPSPLSRSGDDVGQNGLIFRKNYKLKKEKTDQIKQKFIIKELKNGIVKLGGFWTEPSMFLFWKTGVTHHGPNLVSTLETKGDKVKPTYPTVLNKGFFLKSDKLANDEFRFIPIDKIPDSNIFKKENFVDTVSDVTEKKVRLFDKTLICVFVSVVTVLLILFLVFKK